MALVAGGGFVLSGTTEPNFSRDNVEHVADLKSIGLGDLDRGHIVFCKENGKRYEFDGDGNHTNDMTLGYFKLYQPGGGGVPVIIAEQEGFVSGSSNKTIKITDANVESYVYGMTIYLRLTHPLPANAKINIFADTSRSLGEKSILYNDANTTFGLAKADSVVTLVYNANEFIITSLDRFQDNNTIYKTNADATTTTTKVIQVDNDYHLEAGNIITVKFTYAFNGDENKLQIKRDNGAIIGTFNILYGDSDKNIPITAGDYATFVFTDNKMILQTSSQTQAPPVTVNISTRTERDKKMDEESYDFVDDYEDDDYSVPTCALASDLASQAVEHKVWTSKTIASATYATAKNMSGFNQVMTPKQTAMVLDSRIEVLSQVEYDAIGSKDANKIYLITE